MFNWSRAPLMTTTEALPVNSPANKKSWKLTYSNASTKHLAINVSLLKTIIQVAVQISTESGAEVISAVSESENSDFLQSQTVPSVIRGSFCFSKIHLDVTKCLCIGFECRGDQMFLQYRPFIRQILLCICIIRSKGLSLFKSLSS